MTVEHKRPVEEMDGSEGGLFHVLYSEIDLGDMRVRAGVPDRVAADVADFEDMFLFVPGDIGGHSWVL